MFYACLGSQSWIKNEGFGRLNQAVNLIWQSNNNLSIYISKFMHMKNIIRAILPISVFWVTATFAASFNCSTAARPIEKTICSDQELSSLDEKLNQSYQNALSKNPEIRATQREWLKALSLCNTDATPTECLKQAFRARIQVLNRAANTDVGMLGIEILGLYRVNGQNGLQVGSVIPNSSGFNAGIMPGDFIIEINNRKIEDINQVTEQLGFPPGQTVTLKIIKKDNLERSVLVKIGDKLDAMHQQITTPNEGSTPTASSTSITSNESINNTAPQSATKVEQQPKNEGNKDSSQSRSDNESFLIAGLLILLGTGYYYRKQKDGPKKPEARQEKEKSAPLTSAKRDAVNKPPSQIKPKDSSKPGLSKEELLKQQQINAFKKLK